MARRHAPCGWNYKQHEFVPKKVSHGRGRSHWGVGVRRGRATGGSEEVRTAADTQRSQHRAFLKSGEVNSVEPRGVKAAVNIYRQNTYTVVYDRLPKPSVISVLFCFSLYCSSWWIR